MDASPASEPKEISLGKLPPVQPRQRLASLDALRGFDMFWIMGGDLLLRSLPRIYDSPLTRFAAAQMEHCDWAGFHFYDLIFPLFVFISGISIVFSIPSIVVREGKAAAVRRICLRGILLFLLGIFYMGGLAHGFKNVYLAGVLHRIGVAYLFAGLLSLVFRPRGLILICAALLFGYWAMMTLIPVPGVGTPDLSVPGKNLAHFIDQQYLPGQKFEGTILSTLAAVANCLLGVFAGLWLRREDVSMPNKTRALLCAGIVSLALGYAWSLWFPIIKLLWTSSYVLVACGYGSILLAVFIQLIDVWGWRAWAQPFIWMGMNAITIYLAANIVNFHRLAERFVGGDIARSLGRYDQFALAIVSTLMAFLVVRFLYQRKVFLRL
jgi:predicted acyltransferase